MMIITRLYNSMLLVLYSLLPSVACKRKYKSRTKNVPRICPAGYITVFPEDLHHYLNNPDTSVNLEKPVSVFIPEVFPLTAPFLLAYLKKAGYSDCRAEVTERGLAVQASR